MEQGYLILMIPLFGIVFGVGIAIVAIIASHRERTQRAEQRHRERLAAIEKGLELPPDPVEAENGGRKGSGAGLRGGIIMLLVGSVLYFALAAVADSDVALFALIPAAIGVANIVFYMLEGRRK